MEDVSKAMSTNTLFPLFNLYEGLRPSEEPVFMKSLSFAQSASFLASNPSLDQSAEVYAMFVFPEASSLRSQFKHSVDESP